jgi:ATP-binding cassette, subfamily C (CFTR/MRP), member 1
MSVRLDIICVTFGSVTAGLAMAFRNNQYISNELLILSLSLVTDVVIMFSITIRFAVELSSLMVSSQRIIEYTELETEDELVKPADK